MAIYTLELFIYIVILILFFKLSKIRAFFPFLSVPKLLFIIAFIYLLIVSQVFKNPSITYPFTYWGMYSQVYPAAVYTEHIIQLDNGSKIDYPYEIISFTSQRAFMRRVENLEQSTRRTEERDLLEQVLLRLIDIYEKQKKIRVVEFKLNEVHIFQSKNNEQFSESRTTVFIVSNN